jgi:hypothetical protein
VLIGFVLDTEPRRDKRALCLSVAVVTGAETAEDEVEPPALA